MGGTVTVLHHSWSSINYPFSKKYDSSMAILERAVIVGRGWEGRIGYVVNISELIPEQVEIWKKSAAEPKKGWFKKKQDFTTFPEADLPIHVRSFVGDARDVTILEDMPIWGRAFSREELMRIFPGEAGFISASPFITYGEKKDRQPPSIEALIEGAVNPNLTESLAAFSKGRGMILHQLADENMTPEGKLNRNLWVSIGDALIWITEGLIEDDDKKIAWALPALEQGRSLLHEEYYPLKTACEAYIAFDEEERKMLVKRTIEAYRLLPVKGPGAHMVVKIMKKLDERKGGDYIITVGDSEQGRKQEEDPALTYIFLSGDALAVESNTEALRMFYEAHKGMSDILERSSSEELNNRLLPWLDVAWIDVIESNIATTEGIMAEDKSKVKEALPHMKKGRHLIGKWYVAHKAACEAYITDDEEERLRLFKAAIKSSDPHPPDASPYHFLRKILKAVADEHGEKYAELYEGMREEEPYVPPH